jgi:hypothetical protein
MKYNYGHAKGLVIRLSVSVISKFKAEVLLNWGYISQNCDWAMGYKPWVSKLRPAAAF